MIDKRFYSPPLTFHTLAFAMTAHSLAPIDAAILFEKQDGERDRKFWYSLGTSILFL